MLVKYVPYLCQESVSSYGFQLTASQNAANVEAENDRPQNISNERILISFQAHRSSGHAAGQTTTSPHLLLKALHLTRKTEQ